jgi:hypothetical protein
MDNFIKKFMCSDKLLFGNTPKLYIIQHMQHFDIIQLITTELDDEVFFHIFKIDLG